MKRLFGVLFFLVVWGSLIVAGSSGCVSGSGHRYSRDQFTNLVRGKTEQQVIQAVGRPSSTSSGGYWHYEGVTYDPISGKNDYHAQVVFEYGIVVGVNY